MSSEEFDTSLPYEERGHSNAMPGHWANELQKTLRGLEVDPANRYRMLRTQFLFLVLSIQQTQKDVPASLMEIGDELMLGEGDPADQTEEMIPSDILRELQEALDAFQASLLD
jgi:hypothetical protein